MTTVPLAQLIQRASSEIARRYGLDVGLGLVLSEVTEADAPSEAVKTATRKLRERSDALEAASEELDALRTSVSYLDGMLPFTAEGWPERQGELAARLEADPIDGLGEWLDDWFSAASFVRKDALGRLAAMPNLPPGASLLRERCVLAAGALDDRQWYLADPLLAAGAAGLSVGTRVVPDKSVRIDLQLLRVRLALAVGLEDEAAKALAALESSPTPASGALRARWHRQREERDEAARLLDNACAQDPTNLDVAAEFIEQARLDRRGEAVLDAARAAVQRLPVLVDVDSQLGRLVSPPAELWLAVSERGLAEGDLDAHALAIEHAEALVSPVDEALRAWLTGLAAEGLEARGAPDAEQIDARMKAGIDAVQAQRLEHAVPHFERVLQFDPGNAEATLRLADCRISLVRTKPLSTARPTLEHSLASIVEIHSQRTVDEPFSWSYLSEGEARMRLADAMSFSDNDHAWRAFLAICRSIVYHQDWSYRWGDLISAAQTLSLYHVAVAASEQAVRLEPDSDLARNQRIQALTNAGHTHEALEQLGTPSDAWQTAVHGYLLAHTGVVWQAASVLRPITNPSWSWANETLITALLLTDRYDEALAVAEAHRTWWADHLDEIDGVWTSAWSSVVLGDLDRAEDLASQLDGREDEGQPHAIVGMARLLRGDREAALEALRAKIATTRAQADLSDWEPLFVAPLRVVAAHRGISLPPLPELDEALEQRRKVLEAWEDPVVELAQAPVRGADPDVVAVGRALGTALLHAARSELDAASDVLESALQKYPDDWHLLSLRNSVRERQESDTDPRDLAHDAVTATRTGAEDEAASALKTLMTRAPADDAGELLRREADGDEDTLRQVARVLERVIPRETSAFDWLFGAEKPQPQIPEHPLTAVLPSSWFAGYAEPLKDHPLFLRYIPETRALASWHVPGIDVRTDRKLEPDGFQILVLGDPVDEGRASPAYAYGTEQAVALLGTELEDAAEQDQEFDLMRIPADTVAASGMFANLLTMPAFEVVTRRIGKVADDHGTRLGRPPPEKTWDRVRTVARQLIKTVGPGR
jgi:tetratricopeptide (TPR) repeat protein